MYTVGQKKTIGHCETKCPTINLPATSTIFQMRSQLHFKCVATLQAIIGTVKCSLPTVVLSNAAIRLSVPPSVASRKFDNVLF